MFWSESLMQVVSLKLITLWKWLHLVQAAPKNETYEDMSYTRCL